MPLIYSSISQGTVTLAEYAAFSGNFGAVAKEYLTTAGKNEGKFTFNVDGHTFNFLNRGGFSEFKGAGRRRRPSRPTPSPPAVLAPAHMATSPLATPYICCSMTRQSNALSLWPCAAYLVVADEAYGRAIPSAFLDRMAQEFSAKYVEKVQQGAKEGSLNSSYG